MGKKYSVSIAWLNAIRASANLFFFRALMFIYRSFVFALHQSYLLEEGHSSLHSKPVGTVSPAALF
jgi:hypothetical protein